MGSLARILPTPSLSPSTASPSSIIPATSSLVYQKLVWSCSPGFMPVVWSWAVCTAACTASLVSSSRNHGLIVDCVAGIGIGVVLWWLKITYGETFESFILHGSIWAPIIVLAIAILLIRIHPEPADACCKCFEDGVAFAGVFVGVKFGQWRNPVLNSSGGRQQIYSHQPIIVLLLKIVLQIVLGSNPFSLSTWLTCRSFCPLWLESCYKASPSPIPAPSLSSIRESTA